MNKPTNINTNRKDNVKRMYTLDNTILAFTNSFRETVHELKRTEIINKTVNKYNEAK